MTPNDFRNAHIRTGEYVERAEQHRQAIASGYVPLDRRVMRFLGLTLARASARLLREPALLRHAKAAARPSSACAVVLGAADPGC